MLTPKLGSNKPGRSESCRNPGYGGTFAHKDIAFEFASWVSVEFKLYLIKEFQRLKEQEHATLGWDIKRNLAKINYRIHTDAIQAHLIPPALSKAETGLVYANEADVLNMWPLGRRPNNGANANPGEKGNIRDQANAGQLVCLSNLENLNALFITQGMSQPQRLQKLNAIAIQQMKLLVSDVGVKRLGVSRWPCTKTFPDDPHVILDPAIRWFPADESLRDKRMDQLMPPLGARHAKEITGAAAVPIRVARSAVRWKPCALIREV